MQRLLTVCFLLLVFASPSYALDPLRGLRGASPFSCREAFSKARKWYGDRKERKQQESDERWKARSYAFGKFLRDLYLTKGYRAVIRQSDPADEPNYPEGMWSKPHPWKKLDWVNPFSWATIPVRKLRWWATGGEDDFTPFKAWMPPVIEEKSEKQGPKDQNWTPYRGFYHWAIRKPVQRITQKRLGQKWEPTLPIAMAYDVGTFVATYTVGEKGFQAGRLWNFRRTCRNQAELYHRLIQHDIRYEYIKTLLDSGDQTPDSALLLACVRYREHQNYKDYIDNTFYKESNEVARAKLLEHPIFDDIRTPGEPRSHPWMRPILFLLTNWGLSPSNRSICFSRMSRNFISNTILSTTLSIIRRKRNCGWPKTL